MLQFKNIHNYDLFRSFVEMLLLFSKIQDELAILGVMLVGCLFLVGSKDYV